MRYQIVSLFYNQAGHAKLVIDHETTHPFAALDIQQDGEYRDGVPTWIRRIDTAGNPVRAS